MKYLMVLLFLLPVFASYGQLDVLFVNPKPIDKNRYNDIKGSALMFKDWTSATLYDFNGKKFENILINYNGDTNSLEAKKDEKEFIDVDVEQIPRAVLWDVKKTGNDDLSFMDSLVLISRMPVTTRASFLVLLHKDPDKVLFLEYYTPINTATSHLPGENETRKRFYVKHNLILMDDGKVSKFSGTKKKIAKNFSPYGDYMKWCKGNKMKPDSLEAATKFLRANP